MESCRQEYGFLHIFTLFCVPIEACNCDPTGTVPGTICDSVGGQCVCQYGVTGRRCDVCQQGFYNFTFNGCTRKYSSSPRPYVRSTIRIGLSFVFVSLSVCLSLHLYTFSLSHSLTLSVCLSLTHSLIQSLSVCASVCASVCVSVCVYVSVFVSVSVSVSVSGIVCLFRCLFLCLFLCYYSVLLQR